MKKQFEMCCYFSLKKRSGLRLINFARTAQCLFRAAVVMVPTLLKSTIATTGICSGLTFRVNANPSWLKHAHLPHWMPYPKHPDKQMFHEVYCKSCNCYDVQNEFPVFGQSLTRWSAAACRIHDSRFGMVDTSGTRFTAHIFSMNFSTILGLTDKAR